jgi:phage terminase large subunit
MDAARNLIPKCWFDQDKCRHGIEALQQYRAEYDERLRTLRPTPLHGWTSHAADAFRYGAIKGAQQIALGLAD